MCNRWEARDVAMSCRWRWVGAPTHPQVVLLAVRQAQDLNWSVAAAGAQGRGKGEKTSPPQLLARVLVQPARRQRVVEEAVHAITMAREILLKVSF